MLSTSSLVSAILSAMFLVGCESPKRFTTTLEVIQIEPVADESGATTRMSLELKYADCPGDSRRIVRGDKSFMACGAGIKKGDKLKTEMVSTWQSERGSYRSDIVKLGDCVFKQDPKDDANYELVQTCSDVVASGAVIGVRCDRTRSAELVAKCPWLRRR